LFKRAFIDIAAQKARYIGIADDQRQPLYQFPFHILTQTNTFQANIAALDQHSKYLAAPNAKATHGQPQRK
jgi:hypothetical protein